MPVYEYECDTCGKRFSQRRHFGDPHPEDCPDGHNGVHRVFAPPTIIYKGSGFYVTDHARNGQASQRPTTDQKPSESEKQESKPESKPENKTESTTESTTKAKEGVKK